MPPPRRANTFHLDHAQPKLRTIKVWIGQKELDTEVAMTIPEIATGMMFRTNITDSEAMLFLFTREQRREFYMKNCVVSLDAAYIDGEGVINEIVKLNAGVETPVPSRSIKIKYVLETAQGWFARHGITTGMVINTSSGPLKTLNGMLE